MNAHPTISISARRALKKPISYRREPRGVFKPTHVVYNYSFLHDREWILWLRWCPVTPAPYEHPPLCHQAPPVQLQANLELSHSLSSEGPRQHGTRSIAPRPSISTLVSGQTLAEPWRRAPPTEGVKEAGDRLESCGGSSLEPFTSCLNPFQGRSINHGPPLSRTVELGAPSSRRGAERRCGVLW